MFKVEKWEGEDYIITGYNLGHPGVFSKQVANQICNVLNQAEPLIRKFVLEDAVVSIRGNPDWYPADIEECIDHLITLANKQV